MHSALITGGAGGMGLATARILGHDHAIVLADVNQERLDVASDDLAWHNITVRTVLCDITDRESVSSAFSVADEVGELRAVVHTAGVSPHMGDGPTIARINALGTVLVAQAALAVATPGMAVVNVASIAGHMMPKALVPTRMFKKALSDLDAFTSAVEKRARQGGPKRAPGSAYAMSKAFVIWYSAAMAQAFGEKGARILSVSPGSFDTAMGRLEKTSGSGRLVDFAALKRFGDPHEVAEVLAFCASEKPGYLTGVDILCDGGTKAGIGPKEMLAMVRAA